MICWFGSLTFEHPSLPRKNFSPVWWRPFCLFVCSNGQGVVILEISIMLLLTSSLGFLSLKNKQGRNVWNQKITNHILCLLCRCFCPQTHCVWRIYIHFEDTLFTFPLPHLLSERAGPLQLHHFFRHLFGYAGLHLAGGPRDQEQDLPGDLPDVCQEEQSEDQAGRRGSASERKQRKPRGFREGHGLMKTNESIQRRGSLHFGSNLINWEFNRCTISFLVVMCLLWNLNIAQWIGVCSILNHIKEVNRSHWTTSLAIVYWQCKDKNTWRAEALRYGLH